MRLQFRFDCLNTCTFISDNNIAALCVPTPATAKIIYKLVCLASKLGTKPLKESRSFGPRIQLNVLRKSQMHLNSSLQRVSAIF